MKYPLNCPHCNEDLDRGDIYEAFLKKGYTPERAKEAASHYGWSKENPQRFSNIVGVYDIRLDRTAYYICPTCRKEIE